MGNAYELRLSRLTDLGRILELIIGASKWLATKGTDQWLEPWPNRRARDERIREAVSAGKTWILMDGDIAVGTITADWRGEPAPGLPELWTAEERAELAVYAHRMVVRRDPAYQSRGIGEQLLDTVGRLAGNAYGARYLRLDAWTTNARLHRYYKGLGFARVRTYVEYEIDCPSGALYQKPVEMLDGASVAFGVNPADAESWSTRAAADAVRLTHQ